MNQSFSLKSLPEPLQFWIRPMLLISLGLHGLLLATPMPSHPKHEAPKPKKEPEKVKITQLPLKPTSPAPKAALKKPAAVAVPPKPAPVVAPLTRPKPQPIRQAALNIPPVAPRKVIPRPQPQPEQKKPLPTPEQTPPSPTAQQTPPAPEQAPPTPAPTPDSAVKDPFADFPFPSNVQPGSLGLLPGDTDKAARNTADGLEQVVAFYNQELPAKKFNPKPLTNEADLKVYEVSKEGGTPQYLHLISKDGKTVILLASQQVPDLKSLKNSEARSAEEVAFYDGVLKPLENDDKLVLSSVDQSDIAKIPDAALFADTNKFQFRTKTGKLAPKSPDELYAIYEAQLSQNGFAQISKEAPYGHANVYKVTQGKFTTYMYFVVNTDNNTIVILSKDSPSS